MVKNGRSTGPGGRHPIDGLKSARSSPTPFCAQGISQFLRETATRRFGVER
jgi:hypothetical protein